MWSPCLPTRGAGSPTQASQPCAFYRVVAARRAGAHCPVFLLGATTTTPPGQGCVMGEGRAAFSLPTAHAPRPTQSHPSSQTLRGVTSHPLLGGSVAQAHVLQRHPMVWSPLSGMGPAWDTALMPGPARTGRLPRWTGVISSLDWSPWDQRHQGWGKAGPTSLSRGCGRCPTQDGKHQLWERPTHQ